MPTTAQWCSGTHPETWQGTHIVKVSPRVFLCGIKPEYRDCLDTVMTEWAKHRKELPKQLGGKRYRPGVYAFAYWLIRWSGLVKPCRQ